MEAQVDQKRNGGKQQFTTAASFIPTELIDLTLFIFFLKVKLFHLSRRRSEGKNTDVVYLKIRGPFKKQDTARTEDAQKRERRETSAEKNIVAETFNS